MAAAPGRTTAATPAATGNRVPLRRALSLLLLLAATAACAVTGPPASGANSSAPEATAEGTHGATVGGSNAFTPGHTP